MAHPAGKRVLVVEDEYMLADAMAMTSEEAGAEVVGTAPRVARALALIEGPGQIDAAVLDVNLGGDTSFAVADALGAPYLFTTGYDAEVIPPAHSGTVKCEKPFDGVQVVACLRRLMS